MTGRLELLCRIETPLHHPVVPGKECRRAVCRQPAVAGAPDRESVAELAPRRDVDDAGSGGGVLDHEERVTTVVDLQRSRARQVRYGLGEREILPGELGDLRVAPGKHVSQW